MRLSVAKPVGLGLPTGSGGATGNPRNKVSLKPGRSLMDWIRLGKSGRDLTGLKGQNLQVTVEELAKHNTEADAWIAIRGSVYNVTGYMEYHPGGIPELLRGIGNDATQLFDEVHKWVNVESMLQACLIGHLSEKPIRSGRKLKEGSSAMLAPDLSPSHFTASYRQRKPRYEWLQTDHTITIAIYTKCAGFTHECCIIDRPTAKQLKLSLAINDHTYIIHLELEKEVTNKYKVNVSKKTGKMEVICYKCTSGIHWTELGTERDQHNTWAKTSEIGTAYRSCRLTCIGEVSHDTKLYKLQAPAGTRMSVSLGHHVNLKTNIEGIEIIKSYTVVPPTWGLEDTRESSRHYDSAEAYLYLKDSNDEANVEVNVEANEMCNELTIEDTIEDTNKEITADADVDPNLEVAVMANKDTNMKVSAMANIDNNREIPGMANVNANMEVAVITLVNSNVGVSVIVNKSTNEEGSVEDNDDLSHTELHLMIKIYPDGAMTQAIDRLKIGDTIEVSNPMGSFKSSMLCDITDVSLCAAGTGFTPMVGLLQYLLYTAPQTDRNVRLLFYNKTEKDILWKDKLETLENKFPNFSCHHILSQPDQLWTGLRGRIEKQHLIEFIPLPVNGCSPFFCACGPTPFTEEAIRLATVLGYTPDMLHAFLG